MKHTLEFEKPIAELQKKLEELKSHEASGSLSVSFQEEIALIENKIRETRETIFSNLTAHQRVMLARHPQRPYTLDYIHHVFDHFEELFNTIIYRVNWLKP